ncbi:MAG: hypothetical protein V1746_01925 [bacterium]
MEKKPCRSPKQLSIRRPVKKSGQQDKAIQKQLNSPRALRLARELKARV